jgi:hypothetical protein
MSMGDERWDVIYLLTGKREASGEIDRLAAELLAELERESRGVDARDIVRQRAWRVSALESMGLRMHDGVTNAR